MNFLAAAQRLAAESTPCQTPGAQYHTEVGDHQVGVTVDLPSGVEVTPERAALLDTDMHNAMELVLAPDFVGIPHAASELSSDMSMDPTMQDAALPTARTWTQPEPETDDLDPAAPGGPSPYNATPPFGKPVTTDQEWLAPTGPKPRRYQPMPHIMGPDEDVATLHSARRRSYQDKADRYARRAENDLAGRTR